MVVLGCHAHNSKERKMRKYVVYLNCSYQDREAVKKLGAKWDKHWNMWFVPEELKLALFRKWTFK